MTYISHLGKYVFVFKYFLWLFDMLIKIFSVPTNISDPSLNYLSAYTYLYPPKMAFGTFWF